MAVAGRWRGWVGVVAAGVATALAAGGCSSADVRAAEGPAGPTSRPAVAEQPATAAEPARFAVHHALTVKDIPAGARKVRIWFCVPDDDDCQKVLDLTVPTAPAGYRLTRDPVNGHRYLYAEVNPAAAPGPVAVATDFVIQRRTVRVAPDPALAGPLTAAHRVLFAEYLRRDCPHMEVDDQVTKLADGICGDETNVVAQAQRLGRWVVDHTDHYSMPSAPKSSGQGDVKYCLTNGGGGCTDQHGLFIALARARGIPTRIQFGTLLKPKNEGKDVDPGYRCWVQYFAPNYGWVPMDLSAADIDPARRDLYFGGLDDHRIRFVEGRDLELSPRQDGPRLNLLTGAYVEVDGKPFTSFDRTMRFTEVSAASGAAKPG